jgi:hypothetical protein
MTPEERLLLGAKKILWDLKYGRVIRTGGLEKAIREKEEGLRC